MKVETFDVHRLPDNQTLNPQFILSLRKQKPIQQVPLTHVSKNQWIRDGETYTLKPTNSQRTYTTTIRGKNYVLTATVISSQISMF